MKITFHFEISNWLHQTVVCMLNLILSSLLCEMNLIVLLHVLQIILFQLQQKSLQIDFYLVQTRNRYKAYTKKNSKCIIHKTPTTAGVVKELFIIKFMVHFYCMITAFYKAKKWVYSLSDSGPSLSLSADFCLFSINFCGYISGIYLVFFLFLGSITF
jgi:hypothetical protein